MLNLDMVKEAREVIIENEIVNTPIVSATKIAENAYVKCEHLQKTGSFKVRGATYKISKLTQDEKNKGIIACSAGNHAQGVALAATKMGVKSTICMPKSAPLTKIEATRGYGADVVLVDGVYDDSYKKAKELEQEFSYTFTHPYNDEYVIAGQGTLALEILEEMPDVDCVVVPMGGGGLCAGIAYTIKQLKPSCKVIGVQSEGADALVKSFKNKTLTSTDYCNTIADGCAVKNPGDISFSILSEYLDDAVTVSEKEIALSMLTLLERHKVVSEGAGALSCAAVMANKVKSKDYKKIVCIVSGGNIDISVMSKLLNSALTYTGRISQISTELIDKPGNLTQFLNLVSNMGANILDITHFRNDENSKIGYCKVNLVIETRDNNHRQEIYNKLCEAGFC